MDARILRGNFPEPVPGSTVIYPDDSVISDLQQYLNNSLNGILESPSYIDLIEGFITNNRDLFDSKLPIIDFPMGNLIIGEYLPPVYRIDYNKNTILKLGSGREQKIFRNQVIRGVRYISIDDVIISKEVKHALSKTLFFNMGPNVFNLMVVNQEIKGRDLIALCSVNAKAAAWCDTETYEKALEAEFGITGIANPKQEYMKIYKSNLYCYGFNENYGLGLGDKVVRQFPELNPYIQGVRGVYYRNKNVTLFLDAYGSLWFSGTYLMGFDPIQPIPMKVEGLDGVKSVAILDNLNLNENLLYGALINKNGIVYKFSSDERFIEGSDNELADVGLKHPEPYYKNLVNSVQVNPKLYGKAMEIVLFRNLIIILNENAEVWAIKDFDNYINWNYDEGIENADLEKTYKKNSQNYILLKNLPPIKAIRNNNVGSLCCLGFNNNLYKIEDVTSVDFSKPVNFDLIFSPISRDLVIDYKLSVNGIIALCSSGEVWVQSTRSKDYGRAINGTYRWSGQWSKPSNLPLCKYINCSENNFIAIDINGFVWFWGNTGIMKYKTPGVIFGNIINRARSVFMDQYTMFIVQ